MKVNSTIALKSEPCPLLYQKALDFIRRHAERNGNVQNGIIPYPQIYHTLSCMFHLGKDDATGVFEELRDAGLLEIIPYRGIRLIKVSEGQ